MPASKPRPRSNKSPSRQVRRAPRNDVRDVDDHAIAPPRPNGASSPNPSLHDRTGRGKSEPIDVLLPGTASWIGTLALDFRPTALISAYPRIANELAAVWECPDAVASYLNELLAAAHGGRRRVPIRVARELHALRAYWLSLHPGRAIVRRK